MRLKSIKLSGFKSFVDPTTVPFRRPERLRKIEHYRRRSLGDG